MTADDHKTIAALCGGGTVVDVEHVQSVWSGYGELVRYHFRGGAHTSIIAKQVRPPDGSGRSHERKLRSFRVEAAFYRDYAPHCPSASRVARCLHVAQSAAGWLFLLEDLDASGFPRRVRAPAGERLNACLRWLAAFHARFMGTLPEGLWPVGTYWHLATRPDELAAMPPGPLRRAARSLDQRLNAAVHQTLVHGDAKPANFCWSSRGDTVAAVDFQYVGGGAGIKDVALLLARSDQGSIPSALDFYFSELRRYLAAFHSDALPYADEIETEWRALYDTACADYERFAAGWTRPSG
ncbi:MAG: phosphotransferase [Myxococcales bacterium]|nr:phosphotransferase [Myxococcales bacterium]